MGANASGWTQWVGAGLLAVGLPVLVGCGPEKPKTYPVSGKIEMPPGSDIKGLVGQTLEFQSVSEPNTRAYAEIQADGAFTLSTWREGVSLPGAIEGTHKGRIILEVHDDDDRPRKRLPIDPKFTRFESSGWQITVPVNEEVILKVK